MIETQMIVLKAAAAFTIFWAVATLVVGLITKSEGGEEWVFSAIAGLCLIVVCVLLFAAIVWTGEVMRAIV